MSAEKNTHNAWESEALVVQVVFMGGGYIIFHE